jgi:hypothetical protein
MKRDESISSRKKPSEISYRAGSRMFRDKVVARVIEMLNHSGEYFSADGV